MRLLTLFLLPFLFTTLTSLHCNKASHKNSPDSAGPGDIKESVLVDNLNLPWEILWAPDNTIWMTERGGRISRVNPVSGEVTPLLTIQEVVSNGEGGLLGMVLHPDFPDTPKVFVAYDYDDGNSYKEKIVVFTYTGTTLVNPVTILDNIHASSIHNGCRLVIGHERKLFISTGDASDQSQPLNTHALNGKILRINLDGSIPADNPEPGNPYWSYGHRNPQGLVYANGILYSSEHGPDSDDELNIIEKAVNYGWPTVKGYCNSNSEQNYCSTHPIKEPIQAWTPTAAVAGLDYYNSDNIPKWKNSLLLAALKNARLYQLKLDPTGKSIIETNEYFTGAYGRMRDICVSPSGNVYICTSNGGSQDRIILIEKAP